MIESAEQRSPESTLEQVDNESRNIHTALSRVDQDRRNQQNQADCVAKLAEMLAAVRHGHEQVIDTLEAVTKWSSSQLGRERVRAQSENIPTLTNREVQVVALMSEGLSKQKIANHMKISRSTICTHTRHIFRKLGVSNAPGAVGKAFRYGILTVDD
ncbi:MAG: response regulator transcription factor [Akkermansiaceae bacterium]